MSTINPDDLDEVNAEYITLEEFLDSANSEQRNKSQNEFRLFWISHNQINPIEFPINQDYFDWLDCFNTYFEGGYGL